MKFLFVLLGLVLSSSLYAWSLKHFKTDICTLWPNGTTNAPNLWAHCCIEHDLNYWVAGSKERRDQSDLKLKDCVQKVAGERVAKIMYRGVRLGHLSPIKTNMSWGWSYPKNQRERYAPLTEEDKSKIIEQIYDTSVDPVIIENVLDSIQD